MITVGSSTFGGVGTISYYGQGVVTLRYDCGAVGKDSLACGTTVWSGGTTSSTSDTALGFTATIPITAGASKLENQPACTVAPNAAPPIVVKEVYKVLVVPAAAVLLGTAVL